MRTMLASAVLAAGLAGCAVEPGSPSFKVQHGEAPGPGFADLNYAVDFGQRCSPADRHGRHYVSVVWLRANRADGGYDPLRAAPEFCGDTTTVQTE